MTGPCAKKRVVCTIVAPDGERIVGENWCGNPQSVCPRLPGENYEKCNTVCQQEGHAEIVALRLAGERARDGKVFLEGHTYYCQDCLDALYDAGITSVFAPGVAPCSRS